MLVELHFFDSLELFPGMIHSCLNYLWIFSASFYHSFSEDINCWDIQEQVVIVGIHCIDLLGRCQVDFKDAYFTFFHNSLDFTFMGSIVVTINFSTFQESIFLHLRFKLINRYKEIFTAMLLGWSLFSSSVAYTQLENFRKVFQKIFD